MYYYVIYLEENWNKTIWFIVMNKAWTLNILVHVHVKDSSF